jgi:hypothetical protein
MLLGCQHIWTLWHQGVELGLCTNGVSGVLGVWLVHLFTASCLFFALVSSTFFYEMLKPTLPFDMRGRTGREVFEVESDPKQVELQSGDTARSARSQTLGAFGIDAPEVDFLSDNGEI